MPNLFHFPLAYRRKPDLIKLVLRVLSRSRDHHYQREARRSSHRWATSGHRVELEHVEEVLQLAACPLFDASRQNCVCLPLDVCFCITLEVKGSGSWPNHASLTAARRGSWGSTRPVTGLRTILFILCSSQDFRSSPIPWSIYFHLPSSVSSSRLVRSYSMMGTTRDLYSFHFGTKLMHLLSQIFFSFAITLVAAVILCQTPLLRVYRKEQLKNRHLANDIDLMPRTKNELQALTD